MACAMGSEPRGRILCVTSNFPRCDGDSTTPFVLHLAQDLQALGWTIDVLAPHAPGAADQETLGGVRVERFRYFWPETLETVCYQGGALVNLRRNSFNRLKLPSLVVCEWAALVRRLRRGNYELLHSHWIVPQGFTAALSASRRPVPHVATVHGSDVLALSGPIVDQAKRFALRRADIVTANSSATRQAAMRLAPDIRDLHTIPMGATVDRKVDPSNVSALRARYRQGTGPLIVFAGRVVREKGIEELISAVDILSSRLSDVTALIVGDGQDRDTMVSLVARAGLEHRIAFVDWVRPEALQDFLVAGDLFVGPSWFEAQGLVFAEAMLAGTPVIAAAVGGVGDIVRHEETGLLVPPRAPEEIAAAVERLYRDPSLARALAVAGEAYVRAHFTRAHTAKRFSDLYEHALVAKANGCTETSSVRKWDALVKPNDAPDAGRPSPLAVPSLPTCPRHRRPVELV